MAGTIALRRSDRKVLSDFAGTVGTHEQRLRAHILLRLDGGHPWATVAAVLFTSSSTINRYRDGGSTPSSPRPAGTAPPAWAPSHALIRSTMLRVTCRARRS